MLSTLNTHRLVLLVLIHFLLFATNPVNALPLRVRQNGATTVQTVHTTQTIAGPLTETCVITLTPITDKDGKPAVEEVKRCNLAYASPAPGDAGDSAPGSSSVSITATIAGTTTIASDPTAGATTSSSGDTTTSTSVPPTATAPPPVTSSTSTSATTPTSVTGASPGGIRVNGVSTVTGTPTQTGATTPLSTSSEASTPSSSDVPVATTPTDQESATSPTAAADTNDQSASAAAASESAEPFQLPGKKLSVLPIGLGVFAGISVIALIVVGLVTYERTKYRKAFRQRKLAESGGSMGYGGMAQRS